MRMPSFALLIYYHFLKFSVNYDEEIGFDGELGRSCTNYEVSRI
jgi:hypothetical protein